jgi:hypothetical protein
MPIPLPIPPGVDLMKKAELRELIEKMAEDWQTLNALYNGRADDHGWCSDYERRQEMYNVKFKVFQLRPRHTGLRLRNGRHPGTGL